MAAQEGAEVVAESFSVSFRCRLTESHAYLYLGAKIFPENIKFFTMILGRVFFLGYARDCCEKTVGLRTSNFGAVSCLYDLCNVECTKAACPRVLHVCIFVTKAY